MKKNWYSIKKHFSILGWSPSISGWSPILIFLCSGVFSQIPVQKQNYKEIFNQDYYFASSTIEKNSWWSDTLSKDGLDPDFALAIIFPELIRYSSIDDYIEVKALEVLYVQYGRDYADFSVGLFQMKPSFAERIESDLIKYQLPDKYPSLSALKPDTSQTTVCRRARIMRLEENYNQLLYLEAFVKIMSAFYPDSNFHSLEDKLIFYSTAYNTGYFKDESVIRNEILKKRFYRGMTPTSAKYNYSEIALSYYLSKKQ
jgi:hypothetical protein